MSLGSCGCRGQSAETSLSSFCLELRVLICGPLAGSWGLLLKELWNSEQQIVVIWRKFAVRAPVCVIFWEFLKCRKLDGVGKQWDAVKGCAIAEGGGGGLCLVLCLVSEVAVPGTVLFNM